MNAPMTPEDRKIARKVRDLDFELRERPRLVWDSSRLGTVIKVNGKYVQKNQRRGRR